MSGLSPLPDTVAPDEILSRFVFIRSYITDTEVAAAAFLPSPKDGQTSVHRVTGIDEPEIHAIGQIVYEQRKARGSNHSLKGWAKFGADVAYRHQLEVNAAPEPHPRHANLEDWPEAPSERDVIAAAIALIADPKKL